MEDKHPLLNRKEFKEKDISRFQRYLNDEGDMISWSTIKRILKKNKIRLKNAQKRMTSKDKNYQNRVCNGKINEGGTDSRVWGAGRTHLRRCTAV